LHLLFSGSVIKSDRMFTCADLRLVKINHYAFSTSLAAQYFSACHTCVLNEQLLWWLNYLEFLEPDQHVDFFPDEHLPARI
jgi:hypothetical protein